MRQSNRLKANLRPWLSVAMTLFLFHFFLNQSTALSASRSAVGATFIVNSGADTTDAAPGDGQCADATGLCTLRAAIQEANALAGADTINLPVGSYQLQIEGSDEDGAASGDLDITDDLTIIGQGPAVTLIDAGTLDPNFDRVLHVIGANVTIRGVEVCQGNLVSEGGGLKNDGGTVTLVDVNIATNEVIPAADTGIARGGGIYNTGTLYLKNSSVSGNEARYYEQDQGVEGGGIWSEGILRIHDSEVVFNIASYEPHHHSGTGFGGGIFSRGTLEITGSSVSNNFLDATTANGGGIYGEGSLIVRNSYFLENDNSAQFGGGGAIATADGTSFTLIGSALEANEAYKSGCGILIEGGRATIRNSTIRDHDFGGEGACERNGAGIAIYSGTVTIFNTVITGSGATDGGGIYNLDGDVSVIASTIAQGWAYSGGGLYNETGNVRIVGSTFDNNFAEDGGAGISNRSGTIDIIGSTFSLGDTEWEGDDGGGGGISNGGIVHIVDSTFSDNDPDAIYNWGNGFVRLVASTISFRDGLHTDFGIRNISETGVIEVANSIIAANPTGSACAGFPITSLGHNIATDGSCNLTAEGDQPNTEPFLGPLQDNGGPTWTHALMAASPAIDAGDNLACPRRDQRGVRRPQDGDGDGVAVCDVGAVEMAP